MRLVGAGAAAPSGIRRAPEEFPDRIEQPGTGPPSLLERGLRWNDSP